MLTWTLSNQSANGAVKLPQRCARYVTGDTSPVSPTCMSINWNFVWENEHFNGMSMQNTSAARIKRLSEECNKRNLLSDSLACPAVMVITAAVETASHRSSSENPLLRRPVSTESLFCDNNWNIDQMLGLEETKQLGCIIKTGKEAWIPGSKECALCTNAGRNDSNMIT